MVQMPTPPFPRYALNNHSEGTIKVRLYIQNGVVVKCEAGTGKGFSRGGRFLAAYTVDWILRFWRFSPNTTATFVLPVQYIRR
jgi:hypothetical protein